MTTTRLYYSDCYLVEFSARVLETAENGLRVYLDQTAFYPESGGQPSDRGTLNGTPVLDVIDEDGSIAHVISAPLLPPGQACSGQIDWARRFDHMQQHSGQHLLSAMFAERLGMATVSFHLGVDSSTIDLSVPSVSPAQLVEIERAANQAIWRNRPLSIEFQHHSEAAGLRKESAREGEIRIVSIEGIDRSACGGTHVRSTGEIGCLLIRKLDKVRGNVRVEFLCGRRALDRTRADYEALGAAARAFSAPLDQVPDLVASQAARLKDSEKQRRALTLDVATRRGKELWQTTNPALSGIRLRIERRAEGALSEEDRALANGFTSQSQAVCAIGVDNPPSILLGTSADSGLHAGNWLKEKLAAYGGRGGGSAQSAQGSLPDAAALSSLLNALR